MARKVKDLTGQKFGRWTVIEKSDKRISGSVCWLCKCECGTEKEVRGSYLRNGESTSCGCWKSETQLKNLKGQKFERWIVLEYVGNQRWLCKCECGTEKIIDGVNLRSGKSKSCGCLRKDMTDEKNPMYGKQLSEETKRKMSEAQKGEKSIRWKGGISKISNHLRMLPIISQWRKDTYTRENYTCQLTGKHVHGGNSDVHHLKGFNIIVQEAHDLHNIQIKKIVADYTEEELKLLEDYVISWHTDTTNAVLLSDEVHDLFHHEYGYGENTLEQYEEFKTRYLNGEFENSDSNNNKVA